jgi:hypothetical protein
LDADLRAQDDAPDADRSEPGSLARMHARCGTRDIAFRDQCVQALKQAQIQASDIHR